MSSSDRTTPAGLPRRFVPEALTTRREAPTLAGMADKQGYYWDYEQCGWVRCPTQPLPQVEVPEQPTAVETMQEADVRSG